MQIAMLIVVLILGALILFRLRLLRAAYRNNRAWDRRAGYGANHPYHAVSIEPVQSSCAAAEAVRSQRFLSEGAPSLPLAKCSIALCECRYVHHRDRRSGARDRRLGPVEESDESEFWSLRNRRSFVERRLAEKKLA